MLLSFSCLKHLQDSLPTGLGAKPHWTRLFMLQPSLPSSASLSPIVIPTRFRQGLCHLLCTRSCTRQFKLSMARRGFRLKNSFENRTTSFTWASYALPKVLIYGPPRAVQLTAGPAVHGSPVCKNCILLSDLVEEGGDSWNFRIGAAGMLSNPRLLQMLTSL